MAAIIDYGAVVNLLGQYFKENREGFISDLMVGMDDFKHFQQIKTKGEYHIFKMARAGSIIQPSNNTNDWSPKQIGTVTGRTIKPMPGKIDASLPMQAWWDTWFNKNRKKGRAELEILFVAEVTDLITKMMAEDANKAVFKGTGFLYPSTSTDSALDICTGLLTRLAAEIVAPTTEAISVTTTGVITAANAMDSFEALYDAVPDTHAGQPLQLFCSHTMAKLYSKDYRGMWNQATNNTGQVEKKMLDFGNVELVALNGLAGSQRLILTTLQNIVVGFDEVSDLGKLTVKEDDKRGYNFIADFALDVNWANSAEIWVNDQV
jgi:hypothetical protein